MLSSDKKSYTVGIRIMDKYKSINWMVYYSDALLL